MDPTHESPFPVTSAPPTEALPIPLGERVVLRRDPMLEQSSGGVQLPEKAREKPVRGTVLAVGPGVPLGKGDVFAYHKLKPGDYVQFSPHAGTELEWEGETLLVMHWEDVLVRLPRA